MCTINTDRIYLTWRKDVNKVRHIVAELRKSDNGYIFSYIKENVKLAESDGFTFYEPFNKLEEIYTNNVIECFGRRLLNPQRRDYDDFLNYWGAINYKNDIFSLLGLTGAKLLTDNFEFIAPHKEIPARFNTDVSWLNTDSENLVMQIKTLAFNEIERKLSLLPDPDNVFDHKAVKVIFENELLGYIKSIHCENIYNAITNGYDVKVNVANIIKNGTIKEILLRINIL